MSVHGVMAKMLNGYLQVSKLGKVWTPLILPDIGWIVSLLFFYKNGFGIK